jgi:hypothetical protein
MESTITEIKKQNPKDYPCLKSFKGEDELIVLFTSAGTGICVHGERFGQYDTYCNESQFEIFNKEITLKN